MKLIINGEAIQTDEKIETVQQLLEWHQLQQRVVIVELNEMILQKEEHAGTTLKDGDRIELVSFVGGG
ncbi:sulfur carrier protein ThiS [Priestia abyssalis]|uniref:sulfur carrier protein ThiS n=1 Tax=Priestia abyssalis TaxID=1221450 RepID=UPI000994FE8B|nr:sulfur carrier protein ThiS [Priestia abyssalis]